MSDAIGLARPSTFFFFVCACIWTARRARTSICLGRMSWGVKRSSSPCSPPRRHPPVPVDCDLWFKCGLVDPLCRSSYVTATSSISLIRKYAQGLRVLALLWSEAASPTRGAAQKAPSVPDVVYRKGGQTLCRTIRGFLFRLIVLRIPGLCFLLLLRRMQAWAITRWIYTVVCRREPQCTQCTLNVPWTPPVANKKKSQPE